MHIEQLDIIDFLAACTPLRSLPADDLSTLASQAQTAYQRAGQVILAAGQASSDIYLIRKGAVAIKDLNGNTEQQLDSGTWFGHSARFHHGVMPHSIESSEDCLLYVFALDVIQALEQQHENIKHYFAENSASRLRQAVMDYRGDSQTQLISSQIEDIKLRTSLSVTSDISIQQTAQLMAGEKRSATLIIDDKTLKGIATESDKHC